MTKATPVNSSSTKSTSSHQEAGSNKGSKRTGSQRPSQTKKSKSSEGSPQKDNSKSKVPTSQSEKRPRKNDLLVEALSADDGCSIKKLQSITGWLPHSVRAAISGLRKSGAQIERSKTNDGTIYKLVPSKGEGGADE